MHFEIISSAEEFSALESVWDDLAQAVARPSPFETFDWLIERWRGLALNGRVIVAREGDSLRAALPLLVQARPVRTGHFLAGPYSGVDLMLRTDEPDATAVALLDRVGDLPVDYLELFGLPRGSVLERVLPRRPSLIRLDGAPSMQMAAGWDDAYRRQTSAKTRTGQRRRLTKLGEAGTVEFRIAREPDELALAIEETFRLHELRWRDRPDPDLSHYSENAAFHRSAVRALGRHGRARIVLLEFDGRAIAFQYYFAFAGTMFVHRLAFDPAYAAFSPGLLVTLRAIEEASRDGLQRVEFLRGEEPYKLQLADHIEDVSWVACLPQTMRGRLRALRRIAELRIRQRAKASGGLHRAYQSVVKRRSRSSAERA